MKKTQKLELVLAARKGRLWKMSTSLWINFMVFALVIIALTWIILLGFMRNQYRSRELDSLEQSVWNMTERFIQENAETTFGALCKTNGLFAQVVEEGGQTPLLSLDNQGDRSEPQQEDLVPQDLFQQLDQSDGYLFYYVPDTAHNTQCAVWAVVLASFGGNRQVLVVSKSMANIDSLTTVLLQLVAVVIVLVVMIAALLAIFQAKSYLRPIRALNRKALDLADGDLQVDFPEEGPLEIVQLSNSLARARDQLQETETLQRDFIANINHDMKTTVAAIQAYAELLLSYSGEIPEKREEHLRIILQETDHLTALMNTVVELTKLQSGTLTLHPAAFSIQKTAETVLEEFRIQPKLAGFIFELQCKEDIQVMADQTLICRVLQNLLNNAVKFCGEEQRVLLSICRVESEKAAEISVTDYGIGIAQDKQNLIWERYYQAEPYCREKVGAGMGLNIVHQILLLHDAPHGVVSQVGRGPPSGSDCGRLSMKQPNKNKIWIIVRRGFFAQVPGALRTLVVSIDSAHIFHHFGQEFRVFQHGAGTEHVFIERLGVVIGHEEGGLQCIQQAFVMDVHVGVMDEHTGLHIALGVDVKIAPAAGNASANILAVILKIQGENSLGGTISADGVVHFDALFRCGQQIHGGVVTHGHIVEKPGKQGAAVNQLVEVFFAAHVINIAAGIAGGDAKGKVVGLQQSHDLVDLLIDPGSPAGVIGCLKTFQRNGGNKVFDPQHILTKGFVNEGAVGEGEEHAVGMHLADAEHILFSHQRFAAGIDVHVSTQLFALGDDGVQVF